MNENHRCTAVIGIDAGATTTRAALAGRDGPVLSRGEGGAGNALSVPGPELVKSLTEAINGAIGGGPARGNAARANTANAVCAVVAGFAGAAPAAVDPADTGRARAQAALARACADAGITPGTIEVRSDTEVAFAAGSPAAADGLVVVCGSGAVGARIAGWQLGVTADGHGRLIDDAGSGFWIGRAAMRAALRALDGRGPWTSLVDGVARTLDVPVAGPGVERVATRRAMISAVYARDEFYLSTLCPLVTLAAAEGDAVADAILDEAVTELAGTLRALDPAPGEPLVTTGGLLAPDGPLLPRFTAAVEPLGLTPRPVSDGLAGAVTLARAVLAAND